MLSTMKKRGCLVESNEVWGEMNFNDNPGRPISGGDN